ncbi:MAG: hypothetical protein JOY83_08050 [Alphaproteobacteria bacterium]|nr:hypothetical protein [Alphaproteobacteria bacterium]
MLKAYGKYFGVVTFAATAAAGMSLATAGAALAAPCTGPGAPTDTETKCLTAVQIPGNPLRSFDISWVNPFLNQYYFADRSNAGIEVINTASNTFQLRLTGFVGIKLNANGTVNNNISGPDGVTSHGIWVYGGDGDSTLKVFNVFTPPTFTNGVPGIAPAQVISTGGTTRVDEMALTADGKLLLAANNAEDPPFATLFNANGDSGVSNVSKIIQIKVDPTIIPPGFGLSLEQPAWEPVTQRFYTSIPIIANNPAGCNYGQLAGPITCDGGMLVVDPAHPAAVYGAFDPATNTGVVPLNNCGPNGATVGPGSNLLLGCTPNNNPSNTTTLVINAINKNYSHIAGINGSDEVWFNSGDQRYYTGSSANRLNGATTATPVLGVIDGTSVLIETILQGSGSHSVAADCINNSIFVPQVAPLSVVGAGGDTTGVSAGICGSMNGCVAVYTHPTTSGTACGAIFGNTPYYNAP